MPAALTVGSPPAHCQLPTSSSRIVPRFLAHYEGGTEEINTFGDNPQPTGDKSQWVGPGGSVKKNPPAPAGDCFNPSSRKIPHAVEQLSLIVANAPPTNAPQLFSLGSRAGEPQLLKPVHPRARAPQQEKLSQ